MTRSPGLNRYPEPQPPRSWSQRLAALYGVAPRAGAGRARQRRSHRPAGARVLPRRRGQRDRSVRRPSACTRSPRASRAPTSCRCRCVPNAGLRARRRRRCSSACTTAREAGVPVLAQQSDRQCCSTAQRCCASPRGSQAARCWSSTRPTSSSPRAPSLARHAAALAATRHPAHAVEGAWPGRRALRRADRRARRSSRCCARSFRRMRSPQLTVEAVAAAARSRRSSPRCARASQRSAGRARAPGRGAGRAAAASSACGPARPTSCWWSSPTPDDALQRARAREPADPRRARAAGLCHVAAHHASARRSRTTACWRRCDERDRASVLFVDRDGTLIEEPPDEQVDALDKIRFMPGVFAALLRAARAPAIGS